MVSFSSGAFCGPGAGVEVAKDVRQRLEADPEPDQVRGDARCDLLVLSELRVGRGSRVDRQAADIADVREMAEQLEAFDEVAARLLAALDAEGEDRATTVREVL